MAVAQQDAASVAVSFLAGQQLPAGVAADGVPNVIGWFYLHSCLPIRRAPGCRRAGEPQVTPAYVHLPCAVLGTRQAIRELQAEKQRGAAADETGVQQQQQTVPADD